MPTVVMRPGRRLTTTMTAPSATIPASCSTWGPSVVARPLTTSAEPTAIPARARLAATPPATIVQVVIGPLAPQLRRLRNV